MADQLLSVPIPDVIYDQLISRAELTGLSLSDLVTQALTAFFNQDSDTRAAVAELTPAIQNYLESRLAVIKQELRDYVQQQLAQQMPHAPQQKAEIPPSIRPLQVGDTVQIRDPDSPFYLQKAVIVSTSLIRATVDTGMGKHTFLKRDIRFVSASNHDPT